MIAAALGSNSYAGSLDNAGCVFPRGPGDATMLDLIFLVAGSGFFLLTAAYADGCDRL
jgi:hypothetical protein